MNNTGQTLLKRVISQLHLLPRDALQEVLGFIGDLQIKYRAADPPPGAPQALLSCWGKWQFDPEERLELDAYIQTTRELTDDRFSA